MGVQIDLANVALAVIAAVALVAAWRQLGTMQNDSKTHIEIAKLQELATRASVLLTLDERYSSETVQKARKEMRELSERVNEQTKQQWKALPPSGRAAKSAELYAQLIDEMRLKDRDRYLCLLDACGFFETVGYVVRQGYIPLEDVYRLFSVSITLGGAIFEGHITALQDEYKDNTVFENFLWLAEQSRKKLAEG